MYKGFTDLTMFGFPIIPTKRQSNKKSNLHETKNK